MHRAGNNGHLRAALSSSLRDGIAHLAGGIVGQVTHRVDALHGGASGDQHLQALQILLGGQQLANRVHDLYRLAHATSAGIAAGQHTAGGAYRPDTASQQGLQILLRGLCRPHAGIHGRCQQNGGLGGQQRGGEHIIRNAMGQFGHQVGGGRSNQKHIRFLCQRDMLHIPAFHPGEGIHTDRAVAQGFKGKRRNQLGGVLGHDHIHFRMELAQAGYHLAGLIRRNAAGNAQHHMFAGEHISPP